MYNTVCCLLELQHVMFKCLWPYIVAINGKNLYQSARKVIDSCFKDQ